LTTYFDTSFLVSLYSQDANSEAALAALEASRGPRLVTTLGELEVLNAVLLRVFRSEISHAQQGLGIGNFERDLRAAVFELRSLPEQVFARARQLSQQHTTKLGIRTADVLHVAAAMEMGADFLYTFDKRQRALARALRLKVN
jgi:predicted nucleic acid-binding protein